MSNFSHLPQNLILRGSLVRVKRKCGKSQCKCIQGNLHNTWALSYSHKGRTKMIALREEHLKTVKHAIKKYHKLSAQLQAQALKDIEKLHTSIKSAKRRTK